MMGIVETLAEAFPETVAESALDDIFIQENPDIMMIPRRLDLLRVFPAYLLWCARHPLDTSLVPDSVLHALSEYGRCKRPDNDYLNFRFLCSQGQIEAVLAFIDWFRQANPLHNETQLARARRNWVDAANNPAAPTP